MLAASVACAVWSEDSWLREHALKSVESGPVADGGADGGKPDGAADGESAAKRPKIEIKQNPRVFLDITIDGAEAGRIEIQVRWAGAGLGWACESN